METRYVYLAEGRLAYDDQGEGPLVVCMPAGGDLRSEYRFLTPQLVAAGYRVVTMDLRGQGESSVTWPAYTDAALGSDILALLNHFGVEEAFVIGTSKGCGGALQAALQAPERIKGIVLIGASVAAPRSALQAKLMVGTLLSPLWGVAVYRAFFPKMYPRTKPADFDAHLEKVTTMLKEPGRLGALRQLFSESSGETYAHHGDVKAPVLILMGERDPDFKQPEQEARLLAQRLPQASVQLVEGAGHHLQVEEPEIVGKSILTFLAQCKERQEA